MIYNNPIFINESSFNMNSKKNIPYNVIYENGEFIKNCDMFITDELLEAYQYNKDMVTRAAILEGAKLDLLFRNFIKNFMKEGKDYRGLRSLLNDVADECSKSGDIIRNEGRTGARKFLHVCKRILQVLIDISAACSMGFSGGMLIGTIAGAFIVGPAALLMGALQIIAVVINLMINRLLRFAVDCAEYSNATDDARDTIRELEALKTTKTDPKAVKRIDDCIEKIKKKIEEAEDKVNLD